MPPPRKRKISTSQAGVGVDASGGPVNDPTANVLLLVEAANRRQDDLRIATKELYDAKADCLKEIGDMRETHQAELRRAEYERQTAVRSIDREDVNKTAAQAQTAINTLMATTQTTAETLRNQVATTAQQAAAQRAMDTAETNKRLSAVELVLSEGKGKEKFADPAMERLAIVVESLARAQATGTGKSQGSAALWGYIVAGFSFFLTLLAIAGALIAFLK